MREEGAIGGMTMTHPSMMVADQRRCFGCRKSDFALQALIEGHTTETKHVLVVLLQLHSSVSEVCLDLPVGL